jgi:DNA sulfur modification protein DndC
MEPLLEIRDYLSSTQEPGIKREVREFKRKMGFISIKNMYLKDRVKFENKEGEDLFSRGPYKLEICKKILEMVLKAQMKVQKTGPDPEVDLILPEEIHVIRRIWTAERGDWQDSVPQIYREATGGMELDWIKDDTGVFGSKDSKILHQVCTDHEIPEVLVQKLLEAERQTNGMNRRSSIFNKIGQILHEEWRNEEQVTKEVVEELAARDIVTKKARDQILGTKPKRRLTAKKASITKRRINKRRKIS